MKISYTGRQVELAPAQLKKLEAQFAKVGKLLDGRSECEAHVILTVERHLHRAEATVNYIGHQFAGQGSGVDLFTAIHSSAQKLEKQVIKERAKWRDSKRHASMKEAVGADEAPAAAAAPPAAETAAAVRIHHVTRHEKNKPMTLDEALLAIDGTQDYLAYRDAATSRVSVLLRRRDGHFDLVEG